MRQESFNPKGKSELDEKLKIAKRFYISENLKNFIVGDDCSQRCFQENNGRGLMQHPFTSLRFRLIDYIYYHFTIEELFIVFHKSQLNKYKHVCDYKEYRINAIDGICREDSLSPDEAKKLKRKVWDTDIIVFGLIAEMIIESELFGDITKNEIKFPDFGWIEKEYYKT